MKQSRCVGCGRVIVAGELYLLAGANDEVLVHVRCRDVVVAKRQIADLLERVRGRIVMNVRTRETHPDPTARAAAAARVEAYESVAMDIENEFGLKVNTTFGVDYEEAARG